MITGTAGTDTNIAGDFRILPKWIDVLKIVLLAETHGLDPHQMTNQEIDECVQACTWDYISEGWIIEDVRTQWDDILNNGMIQKEQV